MDQAAPSLEAARRDWTVLDREFPAPEGVRLISHERFGGPLGTCVALRTRGIIGRLFSFVPVLGNAIHAWSLLRAAKPRRSVLIANGGDPLWLYVGLLNRRPFVWRRRTVLLWDVFVEGTAGLRHRMKRMAVRTMALAVVWSRDQVRSHARFLGLPEDLFFYMPYKSNHSRRPSYDLPMGGYVFSGGNGKRDYATLCAAVRGTGIPVIVSATAPGVRGAVEDLPNVIALAAWEPSFAKLQAGSRFVVIPMVSTGVKGGGEANICNAMWHGKPVIAADDIAAHDYVEEGVTGFVVPSGDAEGLRRRILELWDDPAKVASMGAAGRARAEAMFRHEPFLARLVRLAYVVGSQNPRVPAAHGGAA